MVKKGLLFGLVASLVVSASPMTNVVEEVSATTGLPQEEVVKVLVQELSKNKALAEGSKLTPKQKRMLIAAGVVGVVVIGGVSYLVYNKYYAIKADDKAKGGEKASEVAKDGEKAEEPKADDVVFTAKKGHQLLRNGEVRGPRGGVVKAQATIDAVRAEAAAGEDSSSAE